jgi:hypothetical protein
MVCTAALVPATKLPTTCDIACDGAGASGIKSSRARKPYSGSRRRSIYRTRATANPHDSTKSFQGATFAKLEFVNCELACSVQAGAWESSTCNDYVF